MLKLAIAIALGLMAVVALAGTTAEPETKPALATATLPDADPVIVNQDTSAPLSRSHRSGLAGPPTRRVTEI